MTGRVGIGTYPELTGRTILLAVLLVGCATPAAQTTPQPTIAVVTNAPVEGSGLITFGTSYDPDTLAIRGEQSTFDRTTRKIAWSAELVEPAGATSLLVIIASVSQSGTEREIYREEVPVANPAFGILANRIDLAAIVDRKPGTYVMRYLRESDVLAEGEFTLLLPS